MSSSTLILAVATVFGSTVLANPQINLYAILNHLRGGFFAPRNFWGNTNKIEYKVGTVKAARRTTPDPCIPVKGELKEILTVPFRLHLSTLAVTRAGARKAHSISHLDPEGQ